MKYGNLIILLCFIYMVKFYLNNRKKYRLFVGVIFLDFIVIYVINVDVYKMFGFYLSYFLNIRI